MSTPISIDTNIKSNLSYFCLTLTSPDDFTALQEEAITDWHRRLSEFCLLVREYHGDGRKHYHSLVAIKTPKDAGGVTRRLETLWKKLSLRWTKGISVHVKKMTHMTGQFHYLLKEQKGRQPLLLTGWKFTWIKQQCIDNIKMIPRKMLLGETRMVQKMESVELVLKYAAASSIEIRSKDSFVDVIYAMKAGGFQFDNCKMMTLYGNVMARCGNVSQAKSVIYGELFGAD